MCTTVLVKNTQEKKNKMKKMFENEGVSEITTAQVYFDNFPEV